MGDADEIDRVVVDVFVVVVVVAVVVVEVVVVEDVVNSVLDCFRLLFPVMPDDVELMTFSACIDSSCKPP